MIQEYLITGFLVGLYAMLKLKANAVRWHCALIGSLLIWAFWPWFMWRFLSNGYKRGQQ